VLAHAVREVNKQRPKIEENQAVGALQSIDAIWDALFPAVCGTSLKAIASRAVNRCPRYQHKDTTTHIAR
jgi:hypothetical protein